jgi:hypothetical protein
MVSKISIAWSSLPSEYWHGLKIAVFDSYRPECRDMRGPVQNVHTTSVRCNTRGSF